MNEYHNNILEKSHSFTYLLKSQNWLKNTKATSVLAAMYENIVVENIPIFSLVLMQILRRGLKGIPMGGRGTFPRRHLKERQKKEREIIATIFEKSLFF